MATPALVTDGVTALTAANLAFALDGTVPDVKINYFRCDVAISGVPVPTVDSGADSDGEIITADLSWNNPQQRFEVVLTGYVQVPLLFCTLTDGGSLGTTLWIQARGFSNVLGHVAVKSSAGSVITPSTAFKFECLVIGV